MDKSEQIRRRLREFTIPNATFQTQTIIAKVVSVDENEFTCELDNDGTSIYDVRLRPVINGKESITIIPTIGTFVLAIKIEDSDWMVAAVDEIDKYRIVVGEMVFEMFNGKFLIQNGGENLGKCLDDLITQIQAIYAPKNTASIAAIQLRLKTFLSGT